MNVFFSFLLLIVFATSYSQAQTITADSMKIESVLVLDSCSYKKTSINSDTLQKPKDTIYIYVSRSFNPFSFLKQDSLHSPRLLLRPFVENGISFFQNNELKNKYATKSIYFYGFGFQIGHIKTHKIIPYTLMSFSKYTIDRVLYKNTNPDSIITMKNIVIGFILPLYSLNDTYLKIKFGYSLSIIKESFYSINDNPWGMQIGIGIERKFIRNTRIYSDLTYIYQKSNNSKCKDFDVTRLSFGIVL